MTVMRLHRTPGKRGERTRQNECNKGQFFKTEGPNGEYMRGKEKPGVMIGLMEAGGGAGE